MITRIPHPSQTVLGFIASGKLRDDQFQNDYLPLIAAAVHEHGKIGILIQFAEDFAGWDVHALWDEIDYHTRYALNIKRMALVGDARWQQWIAKLSKLLPLVEVRSFAPSEIDAAWEWLAFE